MKELLIILCNFISTNLLVYYYRGQSVKYCTCITYPKLSQYINYSHYYFSLCHKMSFRDQTFSWLKDIRYKRYLPKYF